MTKSPDAFRTISEVAEWLQTPAHVLRFWESKFAQVKPVKRAGGRRYYRPADMLLLGGIKKLLHDDGMTIKGVQKILRERGVRHVASLSDRHLEGDEADAGFEDEAPLDEDAPFVEVEPPEPEERLIAFPGRTARGARNDAPADPAPDKAESIGPSAGDETAEPDPQELFDETAADAAFAGSARDDEAEQVTASDGELTEETAQADHAQSRFDFDDSAADEPGAEEPPVDIEGISASEDEPLPALDDESEDESTPAVASDDATELDDAMAADTTEEEAPLAQEAASSATDAPEPHGFAAAGHDGSDLPEPDRAAEQPETAAVLPPETDDAAARAEPAPDTPPAASAEVAPAEDADAAPAETVLAHAGGPEGAHDESEGTEPEASARPLVADLPNPAKQPPAAGPLGRLAWIDQLDEPQRAALREALPALRALHDRLSTPIAGSQ